MRRLQGLSGLPVSEFRKVLSEATKVAVIAHTDMDGLGAIRILKDSSFGNKIARIFTTDSPQRDITPTEEAELLAINPDLVLFVDIAPANLAQLAGVLKNRKGVIVDHHKPKDLSEVPNVDSRFTTYTLFPKAPDHCSTTYLMAELIGERYEPQFVASALLGDENFKYYETAFEASDEEIGLAQRMGVLYKKLGSIQPLSSEGARRGALISEKMMALALNASDLKAIENVCRSDTAIREFLEQTDRDTDRLMCGAIELVASSGTERNVLLEFKPEAGFFISGFIYVLEKRVREEHPEFRGVLIVAQEGKDYWRMDGLSTDPARSIGEIFTQSGLGGGHRNVGGGRIKKPGKTPAEWLKAQTS